MKGLFTMIALGCLIGAGSAQKAHMSKEDYEKYWQGRKFKAHTPAYHGNAGDGKGDWIQC